METTTCQWRQIKLNPLSTQINIYFSRPPPSTAIIPDVRPLGSLKIKIAAINGKMRSGRATVEVYENRKLNIYFSFHGK